MAASVSAALLFEVGWDDALGRRGDSREVKTKLWGIPSVVMDEKLKEGGEIRWIPYRYDKKLIARDHFEEK